MTFKSSALAVLLFCVSSPLAAATIWTGPNVTFVHAGSTTTQDNLTANVSLTRGITQGPYNILQESFYDTGSPLGTQWAFQGLNGNPGSGVTASNFASLTFTDWATSLGGMNNLATNILGRPGVIHLVTDDIYLNVLFTAWGGGTSGGSFTYVRSSPVPLPGVVWLMVSGLASLGLLRPVTGERE